MGLASISGRLFPETRQLTEANNDDGIDEYTLTSEPHLLFMPYDGSCEVTLFVEADRGKP